MVRKTKTLAAVIALLLGTSLMVSAQDSYYISSLGDGDYFVSGSNGYTGYYTSLGDGDGYYHSSIGQSGYFMSLGDGDGYYFDSSPTPPQYSTYPSYPTYPYYNP